MARQTKTGLDYFSHDVDMMQDKKMKLLKAKHGMMGYAVYLRLLEELYRDGGYYLKADEDFNLLFSDDNNIPFNDYILMLNDCINIGLFNLELHENYNILTSKRIQQNYIDGTTRRKSIHIIKDFLLLENDDVSNLSNNVNIIDNNVDIKKKKGSSSTQSKVKESKKKVDKIESNSNFYSCEQLEYFLEDDFQEPWIEWMKIRENKKCVTTDISMKIIYNKLIIVDKKTAIDMLNKSIVSGWTDIYELKPQYKTVYNKPNYNENKWKGEQNFEFVSAT